MSTNSRQIALEQALKPILSAFPDENHRRAVAFADAWYERHQQAIAEDVANEGPTAPDYADFHAEWSRRLEIATGNLTEIGEHEIAATIRSMRSDIVDDWEDDETGFSLDRLCEYVKGLLRSEDVLSSPEAELDELTTETEDISVIESDTLDHHTSSGSTDATRLLVERWADLAIGISEEEGTYLALPRVPDDGAKFPVESATQLELPGKRWKALLKLLAESDDGRTAQKKDLLHKFGYHGPPPKEEELADLRDDEGCISTIKTATNKLASAIGDLGRKLKRAVDAKDHERRINIPLRANDDRVVKALFTTRYLLRDPNGKLRFGEARTRH